MNQEQSQNQNQNTGVDFDNAQGEAFVGLNLLQLKPGQADGPFLIISAEMKTFGEGKRKNEIPQFVGAKGNIPYTLPIAAAFISRMEEGSVSKGDSILIKRTEDYTSKDGTEGCQSYLIKVVDRAKK